MPHIKNLARTTSANLLKMMPNLGIQMHRWELLLLPPYITTFSELCLFLVYEWKKITLAKAIFSTKHIDFMLRFHLKQAYTQTATSTSFWQCGQQLYKENKTFTGILYNLQLFATSRLWTPYKICTWHHSNCSAIRI